MFCLIGGMSTVRRDLFHATIRDARSVARQRITFALHRKQVHLKITTKRCHVCDKRFFAKRELRAHMSSQHQTIDHDMAECDNSVIYLKKSHTRSQAMTASHERRARKEETDRTAANMQDIESYRRGAQNSFCFKGMEVKSETPDLNDELIDMHTDMQLLSSL